MTVRTPEGLPLAATHTRANGGHAIGLSLARIGQLAVQVCRVAGVAVLDVCTRRKRRLPAAVASAAERLGGAFLKTAQALSCRPDVVDPVTCTELARLCDRVRSLSPSATETMLRNALTPPQRNQVARIDPRPVASGSVAQLHLAEMSDGSGSVLLKILRPDAPARFAADVAIITFAGRWLAKLPWCAPFSLDRAVAEVTDAATQQLDLVRERSHHAAVRAIFATRADVLVPALRPDLCGESVVAMEHVADAVRIDDAEVDERVRQEAIAVGLRSLYSLIFEHGIVHCDMHPGNLMIKKDGTLVLLDFGYMARLDDRTRRAFAALFMAIAVYDAARATRVITETAAFLPPNLDRAALEDDVRSVLRTVSGAKVGQFQITAFVLDLFRVQRKHGIRASPDFVMAIMSLLSYEGLLRTYVPSLDFQREALPYVVRVLQEQTRHCVDG